MLAFDVDAWLEPHALTLGFSVDKLKLVICLLAAYLISFGHKMLPSPTTKHLYSATAGFLFGIFCFGLTQMALPLAMAIPVYALSFVPNPKVPLVSFVFCLFFMCICHMVRQYYDYGGYTLDVTGPLMILTTKLTAYAFTVADGRRFEKCTPDQQKYATRQVPSVLEFAGFVFFYGGFLSGPGIEFQDYMRFTNLTVFPNGKIPSTIKPALMRFLAGIFFMVSVVLAGQFIPNMYIKTAEFQNDRSFFFKVFYVITGVASSRLPYYFAWIMAEGGCVAAGLGYNGVDKSGQIQWNGVANVNPIAIETATSFKVVIDNWNINTSNWLRRYVYERLTPAGKKAPLYVTVATYMTSAFWHGFYPGYYLTFACGALVTETARNLRRRFRPLVMEADGKTPKPTKVAYDAAGWFVTQFTLDYICAAFIILTIEDSLNFYESIYFCGHIGIALAMLYFNQVAKQERAAAKRAAREAKDGAAPVAAPATTAASPVAASSPVTRSRKAD
ncbi:hypothetical protein CAOG_03096 [Capsaspora owczarzaki ATCC 30864]|uniref:Uncharacterized protein n=1 Tax=Capsaspora owczarzaki (strain ATCC 30864) TaxID=595528 RepID=A0A0D2X275_CAPO3|nr:hypothetical protein CAOG_03096 [Capsaspora owczarzaki ATCC 30864]KJE92069.1 hypothetical protein CAOG_003096 [Capsaspora owczarzaki ATCC 30864]|eukprot:XP_004363935.1 hypothetical protein CAOG_03096 [Capsaspora owczarzaki ATCC 30864]